MDVRLVGSGPAAEAVTAALADVDVTPGRTGPGGLGSADFGVVVDVAGAETFDRANRVAVREGVPWLAVEVGGVGGHPVDSVSAAVSGFAPGVGCYDCLRTRVAANLDDGQVGQNPSGERSTVRLAGAMAGREAVRLLEGSEGLLGSVVELPHARRRFLPVPGCDCDEGANRTDGTDGGRYRVSDPGAPADDWIARGWRYEAVDVDAALARAEQAVDDRVGVVATVGEVESFPAPYYLATLAPTDGLSDASAPQKAAGVDADWNPAFMKALGEALERYGAAVYREAAFDRATPADRADGDALSVDPDALVRPDDAAPVEPDRPIPWVRGERLADGDLAWLPAEAVHFPPPEEYVLDAITTGLGLGTSPAGAALAGLTEVIERDATTIAWYSTFEPLGLAVEDETFEALARRARAEDLSVTPLLVTVDVDVPVVAVAVHRDGEWPRFAVGSAANLDATAAARSALAEAIQNWMELRSMGPERASEDPTAIAEYADFPAAARAFVDIDSRIPIASVGPDDPPTGTGALAELTDRVQAAGLEPYAARITTRDLAAIDLSVVRVLVPGAQPLLTGRRAFGERARTVPEEMGFETRLDREHHPYP